MADDMYLDNVNYPPSYGIIKALYKRVNLWINKEVIVGERVNLDNDITLSRSRAVYEECMKKEIEARKERCLAEAKCYLASALVIAARTITYDINHVADGRMTPAALVFKYGRALENLVNIAENITNSGIAENITKKVNGDEEK